MATESSSTDFEIDPAWIGRSNVATDVITPELLRRFRATIDLPGPEPVAGDVVPRLLHFCLAQPAVPAAEIGADGHPRKGGFMPPMPLPRRMWAGGALEFPGDLRVGDAITRISRIADITKKVGKSGALAFVAVDHVISVDERAVVRERQDIVYRPMETAAPPSPSKAVEPAPAGEFQRAVETPTVLLFRYSALTFNGHRIHYDRRYAQDVERYPGLVVHGPLQATLLLDFAAGIKGAPPSYFSFRGQSPLFDDDGMSLHAAWSGEVLKLWTARKGGPVAMSAEARW